MIEIQNSKVYIDHIKINCTYRGLLLGFPNEELNKDIMQSAQTAAYEMNPYRPIHLIQPNEKEYSEENPEYVAIPMHQLIVCLDSNECEYNFDGRHLCVICYTNRDVYRESIEDIVSEFVKDLDWKALSKGYEW